MIEHSLLIFLKINHSAAENENATAGIILPLTILSFWLYAGHPWKNKKIDPDESPIQAMYDMRKKIGFVFLVILTFGGIYNGIRFFVFN